MTSERFSLWTGGRRIGKAERMRQARDAALDAGQTVVEVSTEGATRWRRVKRGKRSLDVVETCRLENGSRIIFC